MWPRGRSHTRTLCLFPLPCLPLTGSLVHSAPDPCSIPAPGDGKGPLRRRSAPSRVQSRVAAKNQQQPVLGLSGPGNAHQGPKLAGQLSVPRKAGLAQGTAIAQPRGGQASTFCSQQCRGHRSQCQPACPPREQQGPSTPGSQQVILLGMELPPAELPPGQQHRREGTGSGDGSLPPGLPHSCHRHQDARLCAAARTAARWGAGGGAASGLHRAALFPRKHEAQATEEYQLAGPAGPRQEAARGLPGSNLAPAKPEGAAAEPLESDKG